MTRALEPAVGVTKTIPRRRLASPRLLKRLAGLGWTDGRNVRMDLRWHGDEGIVRSLSDPSHLACRYNPTSAERLAEHVLCIDSYINPADRADRTA